MLATTSRALLVIDVQESFRRNGPPSDRAISGDLRNRLAERLAADLRHFEHLLGHRVPSHWEWSTSRGDR
jgi:hypothetical protein